MKTKQRTTLAEKAVEAYLVKEVKKLGGMCLKWPAVGRKGVPDRIVILPQLGTVFVEVKTDYGKPTNLQSYMMEQIKAAGGVAIIAAGKTGVDEFIKFAKDYGRETHGGSDGTKN